MAFKYQQELDGATRLEQSIMKLFRQGVKCLQLKQFCPVDNFKNLCYDEKLLDRPIVVLKQWDRWLILMVLEVF